MLHAATGSILVSPPSEQFYRIMFAPPIFLYYNWLAFLFLLNFVTLDVLDAADSLVVPMPCSFPKSCSCSYRKEAKVYKEGYKNRSFRRE